MAEAMISETTFRTAADTILAASTADHTFVRVGDTESSTLRFANNQVVQHVSVREPRISVEVAFGRRVGSSSTNRLDRASLVATLRRAEEIARVTPEDPEYLPPLPPQQYESMPTFAGPTAAATAATIAARVKPVVSLCVHRGLTGAGILTNTVSASGLAASSGLFGYVQSTEAEFSLTASGTDSSGWTLNSHRDISKLDINGRTQRAVEKAVLSREPRELPAGHYPVILEPAAVAGVFGPFLWSLNAKDYFKGNSALAGKLDQTVLDDRLSLHSDPHHPDLLGSPYNGEGLPNRQMTWVQNGQLKQLAFDRFTAQEHGVKPTPWPSAPVLSFTGPRAASLDDLISRAERAILITNFWYIRMVNPRDLTVTGMTRDGTFLVENGRIVAGLRNFRFHDSPLRCLSRVDAATEPVEAITLERGKMLLPAVLLPDFYLSSVTRF